MKAFGAPVELEQQGQEPLRYSLDRSYLPRVWYQLGGSLMEPLRNRFREVLNDSIEELP